MAGWSLRARLVVTLVALLAVVSLAIGGFTTVALRQFLISRVDEQLSFTSGGRPAVVWEPGRGLGAWGDVRVPRGFPPGTISAQVVDGRVTEAWTLVGRQEQAVPVDEVGRLATVPTDGRAHTLSLGERGSYRVVARRTVTGAVRVLGVPLADVQDTVWAMVAAQAGITVVGLLLAGGTGAMIIRATLRPLRRVAATAARVSELPLDRGEVALSERVPAADTDPRTEVGQVGSALNRLLGHVAAALAARQASETRVRQFVADASHELRTPLAAIRGYAEVARRGRDEVPPDVAHALRRVESESARMTSLVDDLLLLARLDSGRPLAVESVDLTALVVDAVSDAHVAGPEHHWQLDLPDEVVRVPGDPERLHQVLANLLANARVHTPPGSTVTTSLRRADDAVALSVTDDGPGIPPELRPEVFERFARGDGSRSRAHGSTGLGLAIVAAVVAAHRGTVTLTSRPNHTEFTLHLPTTPPRTDAPTPPR
ncbi:HAMP domain-containing sensor histidine kinase [Micromonospora sp. DT48]|uniref:sensor histidine kinase n=1 Tax=unclassified Micromonospora TaxID=2617518 RepID=UPI0012BC2976|nr:HAMP domain-containing sensor histidine kinase [Micromonospora sp. CP22]MTK04107.1 HAMP domain-containing histidine kinase [Micromonospora sp. CP22]